MRYHAHEVDLNATPGSGLVYTTLITEHFGAVNGLPLGMTENPIRPEVSFVAPKGVPHSVKQSPGSIPVKLIRAHAAVV